MKQNMKQRLFLLFVVSVLVTTPALAATAVADVNSFGAIVTNSDFPVGATLSTTTGATGSFQLTLSVEVREMAALDPTKTIFTYAYTITHDSTSDLTGVLLFDGLFEASLMAGFIGSTGDTNFVDVLFTLGSLTFQLALPADESPFTVFAQSYLGPVDMIAYFGQGSGFTAFDALTLGPGDAGMGSSIDPVPEPASLLLLTAGLLGGGLFGFRKKKVNFEQRPEEN